MSMDSWHGLRAGDQIGNLEYVVDADALEQYRRATNGEGHFPNLIAEDCRAMLARHAGSETLSTVWQRQQFLRPPILGRRVQVGGWVRDVWEICGRRRVRAASFAVDEIGTEILRSEAVFEVGVWRSRLTTPIAGAEAQRAAGSMASGRAGDEACLGNLKLPDADGLSVYRRLAGGMAGTDLSDDGNGLTAVVAGWLECLLGGDFGEDFRWGGRLSIAHHRPVAPGAQLRCDGVLIDHDTDASGVETRRVILLVRDAADHRLVTAEAVVKSPSPRLK